MDQQYYLNYSRIAEAITYLKKNFKEQPSLDEIAKGVQVSPFHFQRMFTEWVGISPKKFLQYISVEYAKKVLKEQQLSLLDTALETGLSGTGRLHDLFVNIEGMTPGEYKNGGEILKINFSYSESPFGDILVASTHKGICHMSFVNTRDKSLEKLKEHFPNAQYTEQSDPLQQNALYIFTKDWKKLDQIKLHLKGTDFQLKIWETLLKIPLGGLTNYGTIAKQIDKPKASRAIGTAIGRNPVAYLIPCHRVIQTSGDLGGYHWGTIRKTAIIGWEAARKNQK